MSAVVRAAHSRGKQAVVHVISPRFVIDALESGADGLVHLFIDTPPTPDLKRLLSRGHAFVIPTLTVLESVCGAFGGVPFLRRAISGVPSRILDREPSGLQFGRGGASPDYEVAQSHDAFCESATCRYWPALTRLTLGRHSGRACTGSWSCWSTRGCRRWRP